MTEEIRFEVAPPVPPAFPDDPPQITPEQLAILVQIENIARFMDAAVKIPVLNFRMGADAVIGFLLPGIGDVAAALASGYIVVQAQKLGLPPGKIAVMVTNILVDTGVGAVPFAGDILDIAVKANLKNANLIRAHFKLPPLPRK